MQVFAKALTGLKNKVRGAVKHMLERSKRVVRETSPVPVTFQDSHGADLGYDARLLTAIVEGSEPWDIKPGLLARARKYTKDGTPYVDVPVHLNRLKNSAETISWMAAWGEKGLRFPSKGGPILFRRVSLRSPTYSWKHPGFGGSERSAPRMFGTSYGPHLPGYGEKAQSPLEAPGTIDVPENVDNLRQRLARRFRMFLEEMK